MSVLQLIPAASAAAYLANLSAVEVGYWKLRLKTDRRRAPARDRVPVAAHSDGRYYYNPKELHRWYVDYGHKSWAVVRKQREAQEQTAVVVPVELLLAASMLLLPAIARRR